MKAIFLSPISSGDNVTASSISILKALLDKGLKVGFFQPIEQVEPQKNDAESVSFLNKQSYAKAISLTPVIDVLRSGDTTDFMEEIVALYDSYKQQDLDVVLIQGLLPSEKMPQTESLNVNIASSLNTMTVLLASSFDGEDYAQLAARIEISATLYGGISAQNVIGILYNQESDSRVTYPFDEISLGVISNLDKSNASEFNLNTERLFDCLNRDLPSRISPSAFRYDLVKRASQAAKRIVLPEGDEPRTVQAAIICHEKNIAKCVLIAERINVEIVAKEAGMTLPDDIEIIEPHADVIDQYVPAMVELRKSRGLSAEDAAKQLKDTVVLGTMMLAQGDVDGLVSGAVHTTADTIRPAFQLIKTHPDAGMASSVFFMLLPENVLVYGDCAINPNPTAEQLASIAIQSADSAKAFGIDPKVAMISYSTGSSGMGEDVEKVKQATELAKSKRPDLLIDGPLQYDAAAVPSVAKKKAPDSFVAGQANVFIFPDLNTGNTTYKAVQRSANVVSIGPMLQGLNKPVNDLSRGALVDDIVYTIALTAIQAISLKEQ